ncbi:pyridoxamine 5'-phosphate oxidase family protein [Glaciecola sp. 1036]|uniref:pyridoxamine 5'-phosphate oxidase family protein n=1 Tax=Alteromonadaceae TaxID=72275 RepID=UPI003CFF3EE0
MSNALHKQLFELMNEEATVMVSLNRNADHSEPMRACIREGNYKQIWFFISRENRIATGGKTTAQYVSCKENVFASIVGHLEHEKDQEIIKELYSPVIGAFFENGILDEELRVVRLDISSLEIWKQDMSMSTKIKMLAGITIDPEEMGEHKVIAV